MDTISGETTLSKFVCLPSEKGSTLEESTIKGKNLLPQESSAGKQIERYKSWLPWKNDKILPCVRSKWNAMLEE